MKNLLKLGKTLSRTEQKLVNGGSFGDNCGILTCRLDSDGCVCYDNPNPAHGGIGTCMNGMCCD